MINLSEDIWDIWESGLFVGENRPNTRILVSKHVVTSNTAGGRSLLFNPTNIQDIIAVAESYELPNIASVEIDRRLGSDAASIRVTVRNNIPPSAMDNLDEAYDGTGGVTRRELGDLGYPGYFTFRRGVAIDSDGINPWAHDTNPWVDLLIPNRVMKTFQGYGTDLAGNPANDTKLALTGIWLIDRVEYRASGDITIEGRDLAKLLIEQKLYPPIIPIQHYPLEFCGDRLESEVVSNTEIRTQVIPGQQGPNVASHISSGWDSSTAPWYGYNGSVYGHRASHAFDGNEASYWLSVGNSGPNKPWSFEWIGADTKGELVNRIRFKQRWGGYRVYVGVKSGGKWQGSSIVPYGYNSGPAYPNDSNRPYIKTFVSEVNHNWVTVDIDMIAAEQVRLTFTNLANSGLGTYPYRAAVYEFQVDSYVAQHTVTEVIETEQEVETVIPGNIGDYCVDEETQIFTRRGWLSWDQVEEGDWALAINPESGLSEWSEITDVFRKYREREMVLMEGVTHSSLTTPDHRWLVQGQNGYWGWRTTETLKTGNRIPFTVGRSDNPVQPKYEDAFVELVAWFYTEGWYGEAGASIAQSHEVNQDYVDRIRSCLYVLYGPSGRIPPIKKAKPYPPYWSERRGRLTTFGLSKTVRNQLDEVAPNKVPTMEFLLSLTPSQLRLFVETSIDGDGWRSESATGFGQSDPDRLDAFLSACALAGIATSTRWNAGAGQWNTHLLRHERFLPVNAAQVGDSFRIERVDYRGMIWCPTLNHHNWLARRRGTVFFTGNTSIVKILAAWSGFFWPHPSADPVLTRFDAALKGRVWGDFFESGAYPVDPPCIPPSFWDQKSVMDGINQIKEILGFIFTVDSTGGIQWRPPNIWRTGNYILGRGYQGETSVRTISEENVLLDYGTTIDDENLRSDILVVSADDPSVYGAYQPGWAEGESEPGTALTDLSLLGGQQRVMLVANYPFGTSDDPNAKASIEKFAFLTSLWIHWSYRKSRFRIPGVPGFEVDDQVRIYERVTSETYVHYIEGYTSVMDLEAGTWFMDMDTHWLGNGPSQQWVIRSKDMHPALFAYLQSIGQIPTEIEDNDLAYPDDWYVYTPPTPPTTDIRVSDDYGWLFPLPPGLTWPSGDYSSELPDFNVWITEPSGSGGGSGLNCSNQMMFSYWGKNCGDAPKSYLQFASANDPWQADRIALTVHTHSLKAWAALIQIIRAEQYELKLGQCSSYSCRRVRRADGTYSTSWSNHSWATAVDLNSKDLPQGRKAPSGHPVWRVAQKAVGLRTNNGQPIFRWGGNWSGTTADPMHFEVCCKPADLATGIANAPIPIGAGGLYPI